MRVCLEHFGQSVLLLVSMTFLRSPVLAIFAIITLPWYRYLALFALDNHRTGFVGPSWTGSSGTSQLDWHGTGQGGNQRRRTAVNTQPLSLHQAGPFRALPTIWPWDLQRASSRSDLKRRSQTLPAWNPREIALYCGRSAGRSPRRA